MGVTAKSRTDISRKKTYLNGYSGRTLRGIKSTLSKIIEKNKKLMDKYNVITSKQDSPKGTKSVNNKMWQSRGGKIAQQ